MNELNEKPTLPIHSVMCRLLFSTLIPVYVFNIVFAGLMLLPYWIITSKVYYDTKHIQSFNNWWFDLIDKPSYKWHITYKYKSSAN